MKPYLYRRKKSFENHLYLGRGGQLVVVALLMSTKRGVCRDCHAKASIGECLKKCLTCFWQHAHSTQRSPIRVAFWTQRLKLCQLPLPFEHMFRMQVQKGSIYSIIKCL
ncbi:hypothetical protein CDAR_206981 [Caerostris darwini]|uniref:Uncharacterized protein n=1 Tax=Caerostris darwini TaxID=1538125 RepID=A0AAV4SM41_9ARAC|nr:hypothetical protein CDAR_206981 [Caerostris darwini]